MLGPVAGPESGSTIGDVRFLAGVGLSIAATIAGFALYGWRGVLLAVAGSVAVNRALTFRQRRLRAHRMRLLARVGEPRKVHGVWRSELYRALAAHDAFHASVEQLRPGPLRDRLDEWGRELTEQLVDIGAMARHGDAVARSMYRMGGRDLHRQMGRLQHAYTRSGDVRYAQAADAVSYELRSVDGLGGQLAVAERDLRLAVGRLNEAAARAAQLVLAANSPTMRELPARAADVHGDLDALIGALRALEQPAAPHGASAPIASQPMS